MPAARVSTATRAKGAERVAKRMAETVRPAAASRQTSRRELPSGLGSPGRAQRDQERAAAALLPRLHPGEDRALLLGLGRRYVGGDEDDFLPHQDRGERAVLRDPDRRRGK